MKCLKARRIQTEMEKDEQEIQKKEFTIEKQGITVVMNGLRKLVSIKFNPALIDPDDPELLEDLLMLAVNEAIETVDKALMKLMLNILIVAFHSNEQYWDTKTRRTFKNGFWFY